MSSWYRVPDERPERWQCDNHFGMMLCIVERPYVEIWNRLVVVPVGWNWRNSWGGPGLWCLRRETAMQSAEQSAYTAPEVYPYDPDEAG